MIDWTNFRTPAGSPWWAEPTHPLWSIIHTLVVCVFATLALYLTASQFDVTEFKAIGGIGGLFGAYHYLVHAKGKK